MSRAIRIRNIKRALASSPDSAASYILGGRVSSFRPYKSFNFVDLVDGSTKDHIQAVIKRDILKKPELGAYLVCEGSVTSSRGEKQNIEFKVNKLHHLGTCDPQEYPLATAPDQNDIWHRSRIHLRPRTASFASLLRVRSELELALHMIMKQMDFFKVHTPSLSSNDSEASSDLFIVQRTKIDKSFRNNQSTTQLGKQTEDDSDEKDEYIEDGEKSDTNESTANECQKRIIREGYFNKDVFLVTSAQLHLENLAASLSRVYTLSNTFRAETSISTRHLCEFMMFEAEEANLVELEPLMNRVESIIKFAGQFLSQVSEHKADFNILVDTNSNSEVFKKLTEEPYIRMEYREALSILSNRRGVSSRYTYGSDIGRPEEKELLLHCDNKPIFITNYPKQLKPFYMKCDKHDKEAKCFDLIVPFGGEVCGGSLREDSWEKLTANLNLAEATTAEAPGGDKVKRRTMTTQGVGKEDSLAQFNWYLDSRRFGSFPHGGFGIGFERLLQSLLGIRNIKDTTAFPRWFGRCPM